jgi:chromosome segregation ATPase
MTESKVSLTKKRDVVNRWTTFEKAFKELSSISEAIVDADRVLQNNSQLKQELQNERQEVSKIKQSHIQEMSQKEKIIKKLESEKITLTDTFEGRVIQWQSQLNKSEAKLASIMKERESADDQRLKDIQYKYKNLEVTLKQFHKDLEGVNKELDLKSSLLVGTQERMKKLEKELNGIKQQIGFVVTPHEQL